MVDEVVTPDPYHSWSTCAGLGQTGRMKLTRLVVVVVVLGGWGGYLQ